MDQPTETVAILSIGEMGLAIAQMLVANKYRVVTYAEDRSESTRERARDNHIELMPSLEEMVKQSDCLLSILPPSNAFDTAKRVLDATPSNDGVREQPLYYLDLNAVSPDGALKTEALLKDNPNIVLIDGGIIGSLPRADPSSPTGWAGPSLIVSGPTKLPYPALSEVLNIDHFDRPIGAAAGLKMVFGFQSKGYWALAIQAFVTADSLGVLPELRRYMGMYNGAALASAEKGLVSMPPKAYRWVREMQEIGATMAGAGFEKELFEAVGEVYRTVAEDTELGQEKPNARTRGTTVEDVVAVMREGMDAKKQETADKGS